MLSHEYGWTTEYVWSRTMREIDWRIRYILERKNLSMKFDAQLHGMEIKIPKHHDVEPVETTKEQDMAIQQAFNARKAKQNGKR